MSSNRLKKLKRYLRSEYEKKHGSLCGGETYLHYAAYLGDLEAAKIFDSERSGRERRR